jgi:N-acetylglucosamine kinase-like BadF-type ATPase
MWVGGLGPLIGDEGSAFWVGREYIRRFITDDKRARRYAISPTSIRDTAALAENVFRLAKTNRKAQEILYDARKLLVGMVRTLQKKLNEPKLPVVLVGGMFKNKKFADGVRKGL